jgi:hypothetical protein
LFISSRLWICSCVHQIAEWISVGEELLLLVRQHADIEWEWQVRSFSLVHSNFFSLAVEKNDTTRHLNTSWFQESSRMPSKPFSYAFSFSPLRFVFMIKFVSFVSVGLAASVLCVGLET